MVAHLSAGSVLVRPATHHAVYWLLAYLGLLVLSGFLQFHPLGTCSSISPIVVTVFFVLNMAQFTSIIALLAYLVHRKNSLEFAAKRASEIGEPAAEHPAQGDCRDPQKREPRRCGISEEASVMFADMVGFTLSAGACGHRRYEAFSYSLLDKYGIEIRQELATTTWWLRVPRRHHAQALAGMALGCTNMATHTFRGGHRVDFASVSTAAAMIAGVIGRRRFYTTFGVMR